MTLVKTNGRTRRSGFFPRTSLMGSTLLDDFLMPELRMTPFSDEYRTDYIPAANVKELDKEYQIELAVPGYAKKDVQVEVDEKNVLHITGEMEQEKEEERENYTRREFSRGSFTRSFQLPESVVSDKVAAKFTDGILSVVVPKKETAIMKAKQIKVS